MAADAFAVVRAINGETPDHHHGCRLRHVVAEGARCAGVSDRASRQCVVGDHCAAVADDEASCGTAFALKRLGLQPIVEWRLAAIETRDIMLGTDWLRRRNACSHRTSATFPTAPCWP